VPAKKGCRGSPFFDFVESNIQDDKLDAGLRNKKFSFKIKTIDCIMCFYLPISGIGIETLNFICRGMD
jgi:hypothetical protein